MLPNPTLEVCSAASSRLLVAANCSDTILSHARPSVHPWEIRPAAAPRFLSESGRGTVSGAVDETRTKSP